MNKLSADKILLRKLEQEDWELFRELHLNQRVMDFITGKAFTEEEARMKFDEKMLASAGTSVVIAENEKVGTAKFAYISENEIEIGYMLLPRFWGKGYGSVVAEKLVKLALEYPGIKIISAIVDPSNHLSIKILEKLNFTFAEEKFYDELPGYIYRLYTDLIATTGSNREAV